MRLYGKQPVIERLRANPVSIRKIYLQEGFEDSAYIHKKAKKHGMAVISIPKTKMLKLARNTNTQGVLAEVDDFRYTPYEDILPLGKEKGLCPVFLDELTDPQNLGAIIRSLACLGNFALIIPSHHSVDMTDSVLRVACGGENYIAVAKVSNLHKAIKKAKEEGFFIAGAVVENGENLEGAKLNFPLALVIGSEEKGISKNILEELDAALMIPMKIHTMSFNVAHATAIFCYEIVKQKKIHTQK